MKIMKKVSILDSLSAIKETVDVMETVLFTNLIEEETKTIPFLSNYNELNFIAHQNGYRAVFSNNSMRGYGNDITKTSDMLFKSIKYN